MQLFDLQVDFFIPLWRRVAVVVICIAWSVVEFASPAPFWGTVFGGIGVYAAWQFFLDGWPSNQTRDNPSVNNSD